jgi:hypothetical protein
MALQRDIVVMLLELAADPNVRTLTGETPLHFACSACDQPVGREIVELLIRHHADRTIADARAGRTPFDNIPHSAMTPDMQRWIQSLPADTKAPSSEDAVAAKIAAQLAEMNTHLAQTAKAAQTSQQAADDALAAKLAKKKLGALTEEQKLIDAAMKNADSVEKTTKEAADRAAAALLEKLKGGKRIPKRGSSAQPTSDSDVEVKSPGPTEVASPSAADEEEAPAANSGPIGEVELTDETIDAALDDTQPIEAPMMKQLKMTYKLKEADCLTDLRLDAPAQLIGTGFDTGIIERLKDLTMWAAARAIGKLQQDNQQQMFEMRRQKKATYVYPSTP